MVDDLHCDPAQLRLIKCARSIAVQSRPDFGVDLGFQRGLQRAVGIIRTKKVGVADEEGFPIVVRVDEPAGDAVGAVTDDLAQPGFEHIHAIYFYAEFAVRFGDEGDVRLAEDNKQVALAGVLGAGGYQTSTSRPEGCSINGRTLGRCAGPIF